MPYMVFSAFVATEWQHIPDSSSLRPGSNEFACEKRFTGYNFGIENEAESKFGTNKELIVLRILKFRYSRLPITRTFEGNRKKVRVIGSSSYREFEENSRE